MRVRMATAAGEAAALLLRAASPGGTPFGVPSRVEGSETVRLIGTHARVRALMSAVGLVLASWSKAADAAPFDLVWSTPAGCPSRDDIMEATRARLGEPRSGAAPELLVEGTVSETSEGFSVTLVMTDPSGRRIGRRQVRVDSRTCKEVEGPTSLVLAMMIAVARPRTDAPASPDDDVDTPPSGEPSPERDVARMPPASASSRPPEPAPPPQLERRPHRVLIGAAAVASRGSLPTTAGGLAVRALYSPRSTLLFGLEASAETSGSVRAGAGEVGFAMFGASARVGLSVLGTSRFELIPTLGARLALIHNAPSGFQAVHQQLRPTILAGPGVLVRVEVARSLFVEVFPEIEGIFHREGFRIREDGKLYHVHRPSAVEGRLSVGVGYEFR